MPAIRRQFIDPSQAAKTTTLWDSPFQPGQDNLLTNMRNQLYDALAGAAGTAAMAALPVAMAGGAVFASGIAEGMYDAMSLSSKAELAATGSKTLMTTKKKRYRGFGGGLFRPTSYRIHSNYRKRARYLGKTYA